MHIKIPLLKAVDIATVSSVLAKAVDIATVSSILAKDQPHCDRRARIVQTWEGRRGGGPVWKSLC
jgi:hypothetical protein